MIPSCKQAGELLLILFFLVSVWSAEAQTISTYAVIPSGYTPSSIAIDASGSIFVGTARTSSTHSFNIFKITPDGSVSQFLAWTFLGSFSQTESVCDLAFDKQGKLYIGMRSSSGASGVARVDQNGIATKLISSLLDIQYFVAFNSNNTLFFAYGSEIYNQSSSGQKTLVASFPNSVKKIMFDQEDNLWVLMDTSVLKLNSFGTYISGTNIRPKGPSGATGFARALDGSLYVCGNSVISRVVQGDSDYSIPGTFRGIQSIAFDIFGNLYTVQSQWSQSIMKIVGTAVTSVFVVALSDPIYAPSWEKMTLDAVKQQYYVADSSPAGKMYNISRDGTVSLFTTGVVSAQGLSYNANNKNIYTSDPQYGVIQQVSQAGVISDFIRASNQGEICINQQFPFHPTALLYSNSTLFAASTADGTIVQIAPNCSGTVFVSGLSSPSIMVVVNETFYALGAGVIYSISPNRTVSAFTNVSSTVNLLTTHPSGDLLAGDSQNNVIYRISKLTKLISTYSIGWFYMRDMFWNTQNSSLMVLHSDSMYRLVESVPSIRVHPQSQSIILGQSVTFYAGATAFPDASISWQISSDGVNFTAIPGANYYNGYSFAVQASHQATYYRAVFSNSVGSSTSQWAKLTVLIPPSVVAETSPGPAYVGVPFQYRIDTAGYPTPSLKLLGTPPTGFNFTDFRNGTGVLSGVTVVGQGRLYYLGIEINNGVPNTLSWPLSMSVLEAPIITSAPLASFSVGAGTAFYLQASIGSPYPTYSVTGVLPAGISFSPNQIAGTPSGGSGGVYVVKAIASNQVGTYTQNLTITVFEAPTIMSPNTVSFLVGTFASFAFSAQGYPSVTYQLANGALPPDLLFNQTAGAIAGTPTGAGGVYSVSVTAYNYIGANNTQQLSITVNKAPQLLVSLSSAVFLVGSANALFNVNGTGFPAPTYSLSNPLPNGLALNTATGVVSGNPARGSGGQYQIGILASNGIGSDATLTLALTIQEPAVISGPATSTFAESSNAFVSFVVDSRRYPFAVSITLNGTLPSSLVFTQLANGTCTIAGMAPKGSAGSYAVVLRATNGVLPASSQIHTMTITASPSVPNRASPLYGTVMNAVFLVSIVSVCLCFV